MTSSVQQPVAKRLSRRRKLLFIFLASIVLPALLLAAVEWTLRASGFGYATDFFVAGEDGDLFYNPEFSCRFFPPTIARTPEHFRVAVEKPEGTLRVCVLGGSAAMGYPENAYSFSRILDLMLHEKYPDKRFEVFNFAEVAINSHVVREIAVDCVRLKPDVLVVYLGNNEVVGPYGPGTAFGKFTPNLSLVRANMAVKSTRLGQFMQSLTEKSLPFEKWEGMSMFLENQIHPDDPVLGSVNSHLAHNLRSICRSGQQAGAINVLCTVPVNLRDCPPFASKHPKDWTAADDADWEGAYRSAVAQHDAGDFQKALGLYGDLLALDDSFAELHFRMGQCLEGVERFDEAHQAYVMARDCDALRFRSDSRINATIREVAEAEGALLVDLEATFQSDEMTSHGTCGNELFLEHVHLNIAGNYVAARELLATISSRVLQEDSATPALTFEECLKLLPYTDFDAQVIRTVIKMLMEEPPFPNQLGYAESTAERVAEWQEHEAKFSAYAESAVRQYREVLELRPDDWHAQRGLAELLCSFRQFGEAAEYVELIRQRFPLASSFEEWQQRNIAQLAENVSMLIASGEAQAAIAEFDNMLEVAKMVDIGQAVAILLERKRRFEKTGDVGVLDLNRP